MYSCDNLYVCLFVCVSMSLCLSKSNWWWIRVIGMVSKCQRNKNSFKILTYNKITYKNRNGCYFVFCKIACVYILYMFVCLYVLLFGGNRICFSDLCHFEKIHQMLKIDDILWNVICFCYWCQVFFFYYNFCIHTGKCKKEDK